MVGLTELCVEENGRRSHSIYYTPESGNTKSLFSIMFGLVVGVIPF